MVDVDVTVFATLMVSQHPTLGIVSMLLSVQCISLPMQSESNMCNLVNIY
jgi:hypothetical protein